MDEASKKVAMDEDPQVVLVITIKIAFLRKAVFSPLELTI
jgi:hypothetical protein